MKLIRESGKLSNTIIAMTKSDLLEDKEHQYVPKIFDRILGQSSDNKHLQGLAGCVAVANCQELKDTPLAEADAVERQLFANMVRDPAEAFAAPAVQQRLKDNMTVKQLIVQLDHMFHSYIVQHWKPAALDRIADLIDAAHKDLELLGPPVEELTTHGIMQGVMNKVCLSSIL